MGESWTDKTVSMGNVEKKEFDSELAHVTVSENRITVEFKDVDDWARIKREIGEETILKKLPWEEVAELEANVEHLYYPHIDIETGEGAKRLYFTEDEDELLQECFNTIKRFWNAYRERGPRSRTSYSYQDGGAEEDAGQSAESADEVELSPEAGDETEELDDDEEEAPQEPVADPADGREPAGGDEAEAVDDDDGDDRDEDDEEGGEDEEADDETVEDVVEEFMAD